MSPDHWFGDSHGSEPYEFIWFRRRLFRIHRCHSGLVWDMQPVTNKDLHARPCRSPPAGPKTESMCTLWRQCRVPLGSAAETGRKPTIAPDVGSKMAARYKLHKLWWLPCWHRFKNICKKSMLWAFGDLRLIFHLFICRPTPKVPTNGP